MCRGPSMAPSVTATTPAGWSGRSRSAPRDAGRLLRQARRRTLCTDRPRLRRRCGADRAGSRPAMSSGDPVRGSLPFRPMGHRDPRPHPPRDLEHGPQTGSRDPAPRSRTPTTRGSLDKQHTLVRSRWELWKNPENQHAKLVWIAKTEPRLHAPISPREGLRHVVVFKGQAGIEALDRWCSRARRCRIPAFIDLVHRTLRHRATIMATLEHGLSNAPIESTNTKTRLVTRMALGSHGLEPVIALAMLSHGSYCAPLRTGNGPQMCQESPITPPYGTSKNHIRVPGVRGAPGSSRLENPMKTSRPASTSSGGRRYRRSPYRQLPPLECTHRPCPGRHTSVGASREVQRTGLAAGRRVDLGGR